MLTPAHLVAGTTHCQALFTGRPFKTGDRVRLEGDDRLWDVVQTWPPVRDIYVHRGWHNNI